MIRTYRPDKVWFFALGAVVIALLGAFAFVSGSNDGSRLASVESLVDRGAWIIDDSIFVKVPPDKGDIYGPNEVKGTIDKLFISGHFYSDKPPVMTLYLAAVYLALKVLTGLSAAENPYLFAYSMTVASSGVAYVVAVICIWLIAAKIKLPENLAFLLTLSFALATAAPIYVRCVNSHIVQMAMFSLIFMVISSDRNRFALFGFLVGLAYTLDLGVGPPLVIAAICYVIVKRRGVTALVECLVGMSLFIVIHHAINYWISGMIAPANSNPAFFEYPGSVFTPEKLTGAWNHSSALAFFVYFMKLMFDIPHGFLTHNLPLILAPFSARSVWRAFPDRRPELVFSALLVAGVWTTYAIGSNNYGGFCFGVRWFMPLLIPAYFELGLMLKCRADLVLPFSLATLGGIVIVIVFFHDGPLWGPAPSTFSPLGLFLGAMLASALLVVGVTLVRGRKTESVGRPGET